VAVVAQAVAVLTVTVDLDASVMTVPDELEHKSVHWWVRCVPVSDDQANNSQSANAEEDVAEDVHSAPSGGVAGPSRKCLRMRFWAAVSVGIMPRLWASSTVMELARWRFTRSSLVSFGYGFIEGKSSE
jgi:hypothetical protein